MMNQVYSKTKFLKKEVNFDFDIKNIKDMSFKKDELFFVDNGNLNKNNEIVYKSKNIFTIYSRDIHSLYKSISSLLDESCDLYEIKKDIQNYMIYGKISEYGEHNRGIWYDFPGINIPYLHGFFFFDSSYEVNFKNQNNLVKELINTNTIIINKPTDLINIKSEKESEVIEFYIVPIDMLKHNEPGVWVPIL
jgi:hypothetical protein